MAEEIGRNARESFQERSQRVPSGSVAGGLEERPSREEGIVSGKRGRAGGYFSPGGAEKVRERLCFLMKA